MGITIGLVPPQRIDDSTILYLKLPPTQEFDGAIVGCLEEFGFSGLRVGEVVCQARRQDRPFIGIQPDGKSFAMSCYPADSLIAKGYTLVFDAALLAAFVTWRKDRVKLNENYTAIVGPTTTKVCDQIIDNARILEVADLIAKNTKTQI